MYSRSMGPTWWCVVCGWGDQHSKSEPHACPRHVTGYPRADTRISTALDQRRPMLRRIVSCFLTGSTTYQRGASPHRLSSISVLRYPSLYHFTISRTMASLAAERYLADKAPPICRVEIAKSFSQLTFVALFCSRPCSDRQIAKRRNCMRTISARRLGPGLASFKASGRHKRPAYTTS
jgi:hypothetical protein